MNILLTGGAGYIGSHTAIALSAVGHKVCIIDNFCNSFPVTINTINKILNKPLINIEGDIRNIPLLVDVIRGNEIEVIIHCAALKSVAESNQIPLEYFSNNICGTISLLQAMQETGVKKLVFSSSAVVYGNPKYLPIDENHDTVPINPYGKTKLLSEEMFDILANTNSGWKIISLRYFNPLGAHESGLLMEQPIGLPNNLMPYIRRVAEKKIPCLVIHGNDYPTKDGTGVRDYIHVMDIAEAHLAAIDFININNGHFKINLGSGVSYSVLDVVRMFERVNNLSIPYEIGARRQGDISAIYTNPEKALRLLGWQAKRTLAEMCKSSFRNNP